MDETLANLPLEDLLNRLVEAPNWPDPDLIDAIVAHGAAAVEPLRDILQKEDIEPDLAYYAACLLAITGDPRGLPELVGYFRFDDDALEILADLITPYGPPAFEPLMNMARNEALDWYPRAMAIHAAEQISRNNPVLRPRFAEELRGILAGILAKSSDSITDNDIDLAGSVVCDLSEMADPEAHELIRQAFAANRVDRMLIGEEDVEEDYREGGQPPQPIDSLDWLAFYRQRYQEEQEWRERQAAMPSSYEFPVRSTDDFSDWGLEPAGEGEAEPVESAPQLPFEYEGPRPGRNDPCWCGSGKKYKKCHLKHDQG